VSVLGTDSEGRKTFAALEHASGRIQRTLARRLQARFCPEIRLYLDESLKRAAETIALIERTAAESSAADTGDERDMDEEMRGGAAE
jgi:ribosome-binding factor A